MGCCSDSLLDARRIRRFESDAVEAKAPAV
jgi:hypothetical protein